jgi:hypothetical protein
MLMNSMPRRRAAAIAGPLAALTLVVLAVLAPLTPAQVAPSADRSAGLHPRFVARGTDTTPARTVPAISVPRRSRR